MRRLFLNPDRGGGREGGREAGSQGGKGGKGEKRQTVKGREGGKGAGRGRKEIESRETM